MENASKALLMAAGVLIGLLILSLAVYLFATFGASSAEIHKQNEVNQLNQFNTQFTSYEGKEDITIYDIITVANLANDNNYNYELNETYRENKNSYYISVKIKNSYIEYGFSNIKLGTKYIQKTYDAKIQNDLNRLVEGKLPTYNCTVDISNITGRVYKVTFSEK